MSLSFLVCKTGMKVLASQSCEDKMRASVASAHLAPACSLPVWASVPSLCALCAGSRLQDQLWPLKPLPGSEELPT